MSSFANWQGLSKRRYGKFVDPLPSPNTFADFMKFIPKEQRPGDTYEFPVRLGLEHGVTHDVSRTAFTLLGSKDSVALPARLRGAAINMQGRIPRDVLAAFNNGVSNGGDGGGSYMDAIDAKVLGLAGGGELYREIALHYGPGTGAAASNIGICSAVVSGTNFGSSGPMVVDLTRASWSAGLWNLMVGAYVDVYAANGSTLKEAEVEVTAVAAANNRVTLSKAGVTTDIDPTDMIVPRGAKGKSCYGMQAILENTGSLFELDAAVYPQWRAIQTAIGGALTRAKIMALAAKLQQNGVKKGGKLFVNANTFADLSEEANTLQRFNDEKSSDVRRQGAENLEYKTPAGIIEVAVDTIMKQSLAMFFANGVAKRVGSTDLTFRTQGSQEWFFQELENAAGAQLQMFGNQAPIAEIPYHCAILSTISNTGDTLPSA